MAEFCKECFINNILNSSDKEKYDNGYLRIVMFNEPDLCEGCGEILPVVNYIEEN